MTDLRELLDEVAVTGVGRTRPASPDDLWRRGVRRHRLRMVGTAVAVLAMVATGSVLGAVVAGSHHVAPAGGGPSGVHLPLSVGAPRSDSPGTDQAGPLGTLAVLWLAQREGHRDPAPFGVSAASGQYRFLDLPRLAGTDGMALSPDGRTVAYWTTGRVRGTGLRPPRTDQSMRVVNGIAMYDTRTGRSRFAPIPSEHGLDPQASGPGIRWTDNSTVLFSYAVLGRVTGSGGDAVGGCTCAWSRGGRPKALRHPPDLGSWTPAHGGHVVVLGQRRTALLPTGATETTSGVPLVSLPAGRWSAATTDGSTIAALETGPAESGGAVQDWSTGPRLFVGAMTGGHVANLIQVHGLQGDIVGWSGPGSVLVTGAEGRQSGFRRYLYQVDTHSGRVTKLGSMESTDVTGGIQYAIDLAPRGLVDRPVPDQPVHTSWSLYSPVALLGGALAAVLAFGFLLLRRRRAFR